jgi:Family of unknown function (DUF5989)
MARSNHSMTGELWVFLRERKKWWLGPIILVLVLFGGLLVLAQGSAVAPFIYTIFWMRDASPRALRKFGLTVGGVFLLLGAVSWWRGHLIAPRVM